MRTLASLFLAFLIIGTTQVALGQNEVYTGQRVSAQHTVSWSPDANDGYSYTTGTFGLYQSVGNHTFEQSASLIGYKGEAYLSGYAAWTYSSTVWQRLSVSATPLLDQNNYRRHFVNPQYILSVPFGNTGFALDNVASTKYFFDNNLNISYSPFLYYEWKDSGSGLFFNLGPRAYLNTYQETSPRYWSPRLFYQIGAGAKLGMYGDPFTFVLDSFTGVSREHLWNGDWTRNNNLYLSFRTSYGFDSGFEFFGSATWASSRNLESPVNFSEAIGNIGLAYNW